MEKGTSQFCWSAGRCGAMRRGVPGGHAAKARACSSQGSPHGQAAKAKAWPHGQAAKAKARSQGQGSPHGQAAKAKACLRACCHGQGQGHGSPHGQAAKAKARSQGLGMLAWARWHALGTPYKAMAALGGAAAAKPR